VQQKQPAPASVAASVAPPAPVSTQPTVPPAPKTWANLAATNPKKWGAAVAQESRGMSVEAPSPPPQQQPQAQPRSGTQTPVSASGPGAGRGGHHQNQHQQKGGRESHLVYQQAIAVTTPAVFVKGVVETISEEQLGEELLKFGKVKVIEIVRSRACAFVEYEELESAKRAIVASLSVQQGGDGGIHMDGGQRGPVRIVIETKKE
ncbi:hypothetical protein EW145_g8688, partial [Phellinidium pouzarii]